MMENTTPEEPASTLDDLQLAEAREASSKGITSAQVRVLCVNGDINTAIIGYGKDCTNAYKDAEVKARAWCVPKGGTQKITRVKCPLV
jgi:hypothetical protein